jgi:ABC-type transport system involved in multi-copper enzyme maturation permease subunit
VARRRLGRILTVARNTFREAVRERVLLNLVLFAVLLIVSGLFVRQLSIRQDVKVIKDLSLAAMDIFGTIIAVIVGVGLVSKEIERRSVYPLLAKPLTRTELLLGKFGGLAFTLLVNVSAMTAGMLATLAYVSREHIEGVGVFDAGVLAAALSIYLSLLLVVALALFASTLTSSIAAALTTVVLVVAGRYSDVILNMGDVLPGVPAWITTGLYYALPNFATFDLKHRAVYGHGIAPVEVGWIALYALVYVTLVLLVTAGVFRRKELP